MKKGIALSFTILCIIAGGILIYKDWPLYRELRFESYTSLVTSLALTMLILLLNSVFNIFAGRILGVHLSFRHSTLSTAINSLGNLLMPLRSGTIAAAYYLKKNSNLDYTKFVALLGSYFLFSLALQAFFATISVYDSILIQPSLKLWLVAVFLLIFFLIIIIGSLRIHFPTFGFRQIQLLNDSILHFKSLFATNKSKVTFTLLTVLQIGVALIYFIQLFASLGYELNLTGALIFSISGQLLVAATITPGNLGIKEAVLAAVGTLVGVPPHISIALSLTDRIIGIFASVLIYLCLKVTAFKSRKTQKEDAM